MEAWVTAIIFLLVQAGALIAILTQIRNELKHVNLALKDGGIIQTGLGAKLDKIESRLDRLETRLEGYTDLKAKVERAERFCIITHGDGTGRDGKS